MSLQDTIHALEYKLLHSDWSEQREALEALLGENFREINPDGVVVNRQDVIQWLLHKDPTHRWEIIANDIIELDERSVLVTYHAKQSVPEKPGSNGAMHLSLWQKHSQSGVWQIVLHQSTRNKHPYSG